jgi:hypothetical protein
MIMQRPVLTLAMLLAAAPVSADPAIGTALQVGQSLGGATEARLGSTVYVLHPIGRWLVGGELAGSIEGYYGSWGCSAGRQGPGEAVPSVGVVCARPSLGAHVFTGASGQPSPRAQMRLLGGLGATALWLLPARGGYSQRNLAPSGLLRADFLLMAGTLLDADWWVGTAVEERAVALRGVRFSGSAGLLLEGRSR